MRLSRVTVRKYRDVVADHGFLEAGVPMPTRTSSICLSLKGSTRAFCRAKRWSSWGSSHACSLIMDRGYLDFTGHWRIEQACAFSSSARGPIRAPSESLLAGGQTLAALRPDRHARPHRAIGLPPGASALSFATRKSKMTYAFLAKTFRCGPFGQRSGNGTHRVVWC